MYIRAACQVHPRQPRWNRSLSSSQGFSDFGAAAALHSATRLIFCVLALWDRDDFFGHPRFSYLPDGIVLSFDLACQNLQPIDSPKFATIDWPCPNCLKTDGTLNLWARSVSLH
jgi:hypothetical protein